MTPLHITSLHDYIELAKVLLKAGAKLDAKDSNGKVCLMEYLELDHMPIPRAYSCSQLFNIVCRKQDT